MLSRVAPFPLILIKSKYMVMKILDREGLQTLTVNIDKGYTRASVGENLIASVDGLVTLYSSMNTTMTNRFAAVDTSLAKKADAEAMGTEIQAIRNAVANKPDTAAVGEAMRALTDTHAREMRVMGYHLGLPEYTVEQMFAWDPATESAFQMYKDDTRLEVWPRVDMHAVTNTGQMFYGCTSLTEVYEISMPACETAAHMFNSCTALTSVAPMTLSNNITATNGMFYGCTSLEEVTIISRAERVAGNSMFQGCTKLKRADLGYLRVGNGDVMFYGCTELEELTFQTSVLSSCNMMFKNCSKLRKINGNYISFLGISDMQDCFHGCTALAYANLFQMGWISGDTLDLSALENWGNEDEATGGVPGALKTMQASLGLLPNYSMNGGKTLKVSESLLQRIQENDIDRGLLMYGWTIVT